MSANSSKSTSARKPAKPFAGFPLFPHAVGQWAKKIRGKLKYFGSWREDPEGTAALLRYNYEWPYLKEGKTPPVIDTSKDGCSLRLLCNAFLLSKRNKLASSELSERSYRDYFVTCQGLIQHFGKDRRVDDLRPDDFEAFRAALAKRFGITTLKNEINRCRVLFKFAHDQRLIDRPVSFGQSFDRPSAKMLRREKNSGGAKLFERDEIHRILDAADPILRGMVYLGLNCAFGNTDVSSLPQSAIDFERGWVTFPRPKTEIPRRIALWKETLAALKTALAVRPKPKDAADEGLIFLTKQGRPWVRVHAKHNADDDGTDHKPRTPIDALTQRFTKLLKRLGINGRRGLGFYTLRHCFETIGGESKDQVAVDACMGHVDASMAGNYRHKISDERLRAVTDTIHEWLFAQPDKPRSQLQPRVTLLGIDSSDSEIQAAIDGLYAEGGAR